jgi:hypothetical protein
MATTLKPRLVMPTPDEIAYFHEHEGELNVPALVSPWEGPGDDPWYYVDADELRTWRASQSTSVTEQPK